MAKSIVGIDWPVVDLFFDFPDELRKKMLAEQDGRPHFQTLAETVLEGHAERYTGQTIPGGTMTNMLATVAALGGNVTASLIGITGPDSNGIVVRRNLGKRGIDLLYDLQPQDKSAVMYALKDVDGETYYKPSAGTARTGLTAALINEKITDPANTIMAMQHGFIVHPDVKAEVRDAILARQAEGAMLALGLQDIQYDSPSPLIYKADFIFGNRAEFRAFTGGQTPDQIVDGIRIKSREQDSTYLLTEGKKGMMVIRNGRIHAHADASPIDPADLKCTVGAGDAVMGGFLHAIANGWDTQPALNLAALCAREALKQDGGQPARTEHGHLNHLLAQATPGS